MTSKEIKISYVEYAPEELPGKYKDLADAAVKALEGSYAPYSRFNVGAAVLLSDGRTFTGSNQENMAYPSGLCAERTALFYAHAHAEGAYIKAIVVVASQNGKICPVPATPCGDCRQVMAEFQKEGGHPIEVILVGSEAVWVFSKVDDILPFIFDSLK
ncbi:MAG: cytidine deaminase [Bacteroidales bacterium]|nr:cytidine deaminase [Bacteroidales bacterium]